MLRDDDREQDEARQVSLVFLKFALSFEGTISSVLLEVAHGYCPSC